METLKLVSEWGEFLRGLGRAAGTVTVRTSHARRFIEYAFGPARSVSWGNVTELEHITANHVAMWFSVNEWSPAARASARASLCTFFDWTTSNGLTSSNPARGVPRVPVPRGVPRPIPDAYILDTMRTEDNRVSLAVELMAKCGLRRGEVVKIRSADVEPVGNGWVLTVVGKGGHTRRVPCPPHLARTIKRAPGYLFPGAQNGHISAGWLGKLISRHLPGDYTSHQLRHRYGTTAYQATHDLRAVQVLLGHASPTTTQIYAAASDESIIRTARMAWSITA